MSDNDVVDFIEVFYSEDGRGWFWRAKSANGKKVAVGGEPFASKQNAERAAGDLFPAVTDYREVENA